MGAGSWSQDLSCDTLLPLGRALALTVLLRNTIKNPSKGSILKLPLITHLLSIVYVKISHIEITS